MSESQFTEPAECGAKLPVSGSLLFLVSVAGLFLELMLIRWLGSEVRVFGYLQNAVLVICFLGLGMGCWTCRQPIRLRQLMVRLALLVFLLAVAVTWLDLGRLTHLTWFFTALTNYAAGESPGAGIAWGICWTILEAVLVLLVMVLVWDLFVPLGRLLGRLLDDHPHTIKAYSINIAGSLVGIWLFVGLSVLYLPPVAWLALLALMLAWLAYRLGSLGAVEIALLALTIGLGWLASHPPGVLEIYWSPYQKLTLANPDPDDERFARVGKFIVCANNGSYQGMLDLRPEMVAKQPDVFPAELAGLSQYDIPLLLQPKPERVLVVGAGTGNDVAGARRGGARHITAVDIDPAIMLLGQKYHPEEPYRPDGIVTLVNDDARSFFASCNDRFDLIIFGLLDAPRTKGNANVPLDNYVYTRESLERARGLLTADGVLVLTFERLRPFIPRRMFQGLTEVFGHEPTYFCIPLTNYGWGGVMFVTGADQAKVNARIASNERLAAQVARWQKDWSIETGSPVPSISDDWPYLYLERPSIPLLYFGLALALVLLFYRGMRRMHTPGILAARQPVHLHFFFLGAAFMLLEVQNISKAAVVLGNTWWVNAVIISSILGLVLLANLIAAGFPRLPLGPVYALLWGTCAVLYFVDISRFAVLPYPGRALVVGIWTCLPMLLSGILFIRSFAVVPGKDLALGANLLGALAGGLLQSITFVAGLKFLLLIVAGLYFAAFLTRPATARKQRSEQPVPVAAA
jgi:spermidine synthase